MRIRMESYGCSANMSDSHIMMGLLQHDHSFSDDANTVIINTCTVKGPTERKIIRSIRRHYENDKRIIITGCMAEAQSTMLQEMFPRTSILGPDHIDRIGEIVLSEESQCITGKAVLDKAALPQKSNNSVSGIIQISRGCDSACTYCITKAAKGSITSYPESSIIEKARSMIGEGKKEIWITSQDNTAYGTENDGIPGLARIIKRLSRLEGDFMIRNGMGNPHNLNLFLDELIDAYKSAKVYGFLHLPLQSGSDAVLRRMRRNYTVKEYRNIVDCFRREIPGITIATDIIYGYPGETDEDFDMTLSLLKETSPDIVNISRFWPRPGTYASRLEMLRGEVLMDRGRRITGLFREISEKKNSSWVGWGGSILLCEDGRNGSIIGRNHAYRTIAISSEEVQRARKDFGQENIALGRRVNAAIIGHSTFHLKARITGDYDE